MQLPAVIRKVKSGWRQFQPDRAAGDRIADGDAFPHEPLDLVVSLDLIGSLDLALSVHCDASSLVRHTAALPRKSSVRR